MYPQEGLVEETKGGRKEGEIDSNNEMYHLYVDTVKLKMNNTR
jgi:hypothetical protein